MPEIDDTANRESLFLTEASALTGESPLWDDDRNCVWWIDVQGQRLFSTEFETGKTSEYSLPSMPGFAALERSGWLVLGLEDGLWLFQPETLRHERLETVEADLPGNRLNDAKADRAGRLWFGSMNKADPHIASGSLYVRHVGGSIESILEGVCVPNSIAFSPDHKTFYFADTPRGIVRSFDYSVETGRLGASRDYARYSNAGKPDGACVDRDGGVWIAVVGGSRLDRYRPDGSYDRQIVLPVSRPTMAAFGGPDLLTLFITSQRRFLAFSELAKQPMAGKMIGITADFSGLPAMRMLG